MNYKLKYNLTHSPENCLVELLTARGVENIEGYINPSKEYDECFSEKGKEYRKKLNNKSEKYRGMADFYYLFDEHNVLDKKDAPCDKGQEQLEFLMKRRIKIK